MLCTLTVSCKGNPGRGGFGVIYWSNQDDKDEYHTLQGGFTKTTNSRMELYAVIIGLINIPRKNFVDVYSDSKYVVDAVNQGWLKNWESNHWIKSNKKPVQNIDLWKRLLPLLQSHDVTFHHVAGHSGDKWNDEADNIASMAANSKDLRIDKGYED